MSNFLVRWVSQWLLYQFRKVRVKPLPENILFSEKENVFMCLVAFQKIFRKIFSDVWKRRRKRQTQEKYHQRSRSRDQRHDLAIDASRARDNAISRSTRCEIVPLIAISVEGEIAINCAISRRREIVIFTAIVGLEIGAAWSSESVGERRTNCSVSSPLARARSLSLSLFPEML